MNSIRNPAAGGPRAVSFVCDLMLWCIVALLTACGGGAGGGGGDGGSTTPPSLLSPLAVPNEPSVPAGLIVGTVFTMPGVRATAGVAVELTDLTQGPIVIAAAATDANGQFTIVLPASAQASPRLLMRASLPNGDLRALAATPRTSITVGTETIVRELEQRIRVGALSPFDLDSSEIEAGQRMVDLLSHNVALAKLNTAQSLIVALRQRLAFRADWNWWLSGLPGSPASRVATGDIARLIPRAGAFNLDGSSGGDVEDFRAEWSVQGVPVGAVDIRLAFGCRDLPERIHRFDEEQECAYGGVSVDPTRAPLLDSFKIDPAGVKIAPAAGLAPSVMHQPLLDMGFVRMLDFPWRLGSDVVYASGAIRVRRTVFAPEAVTVGGHAVMALPVVLDFDFASGSTEVGIRIHTWLAPEIGRVKVDHEVKSRIGGAAVQTTRFVATRTDIDELLSGSRVPGPPFTSGPALTAAMSAHEVPLRHRHTAYSEPTRKLYLSTPDEPGVVVELDIDSRQLRRSASLGSDIKSLAVSGEGSRAYVGTPGGEVVEILTSSLSVVRRIGLPLSSGGEVQSAYRIAVDPSDALRAAALAHPAQTYGGDVIIWRDGMLEPAAPPHVPFYVDSFGHYIASDITWTPDGRYLDLWSGWKVSRLLTGGSALFEEMVFDLASTENIELVPQGSRAGYWMTRYGSALAQDLSHVKKRSTAARWGEDSCTWIDASRVLCLERELFIDRWHLTRFVDSELLGIYTAAADATSGTCADSFEEPLAIGAGQGVVIWLKHCSIWLLQMPGE